MGNNVDFLKNVKNAIKAAAQNDFITLMVKSISPNIFLNITGVIGNIWLYDTRLPFGASESVGTFHRITQSITRMMSHKTSCTVLCYLDDFLLVSDTKQACQESMNKLLNLLSNLSFTINWDKVVRPSQRVTFLGISLDSVIGTMSIPTGKLLEIRNCANSWWDKRKATKREIQSLIEKMFWAARCIKAMRPALRSLIDLQKSLRRPSHYIRLPKHVLLDIRYFIHWSMSFNGVTFFPSMEKATPQTSVYTDASLSAGAAYHNGDFTYSFWAADMPLIAAEHIYIKELGAILLAFRRWCNSWKYRTVHVFTDNKGAEWALRKGRTRNCNANNILKEILWISAWCNINILVHYVTSKNNRIADALSRIDDEQYLMYAAKLLSPVGCHILHPGYNILMNMSLTSFSFLTQAFRRQTRRSWMSRSANTGRWLYPRRVPGRTNLSVTPTFGYVGIVDTHRYQRRPSCWPVMLPTWPVR